MLMECERCGTVQGSESVGRYVYSECGLRNITLTNAVQFYCPKCQGWIGISLWRIDLLHRTIALALSRKRHRSAAENIFIRKIEGPLEPNPWWTYRRARILVECTYRENPSLSRPEVKTLLKNKKL